MTKLPLISAAAAVLLALLIVRIDAARMPQVVKGEDALSVAFADAKETISVAMVQKADSYYHGGIDMDCHESHEHSHEAHDHSDADKEHDHDHEEHDHEHDHGHQHDPWRWTKGGLRITVGGGEKNKCASMF